MQHIIFKMKLYIFSVKVYFLQAKHGLHAHCAAFKLQSISFIHNFRKILGAVNAKRSMRQRGRHIESVAGRQ